MTLLLHSVVVVKVTFSCLLQEKNVFEFCMVFQVWYPKFQSICFLYLLMIFLAYIIWDFYTNYSFISDRFTSLGIMKAGRET